MFKISYLSFFVQLDILCRDLYGEKLNFQVVTKLAASIVSPKAWERRTTAWHVDDRGGAPPPVVWEAALAADLEHVLPFCSRW